MIELKKARETETQVEMNEMNTETAKQQAKNPLC